ncbi:hypothetical protein FRB91_000650 [Serendipita sp. 411]|nr:hypothetical protein FRB91_000650 [Serendipita sp. 411]
MPHSLFSKVVLISTFFHSTRAHMGAFAKGMYCLNGTSGSDNPDTNEAVFPVYNLPESQWWMHHDSGCDAFPPAPGDLLELFVSKILTAALVNLILVVGQLAYYRLGGWKAPPRRLL